MNIKKIVATSAAGLIAVGVLAGCTDTDAKVVGDNIAVAAEQFELDRRVIFINGITDTYIMTIEGKCNVEDQETQVEVLCKTAGGEYKKHLLGLSDNVTYFVEQLESESASSDNYRVIFKPETIIPDIDRP